VEKTQEGHYCMETGAADDRFKDDSEEEALQFSGD
jgi:hypothetical protein